MRQRQLQQAAGQVAQGQLLREPSRGSHGRVHTRTVGSSPQMGTNDAPLAVPQLKTERLIRREITPKDKVRVS